MTQSVGKLNNVLQLIGQLCNALLSPHPQHSLKSRGSAIQFPVLLYSNTINWTSRDVKNKIENTLFHSINQNSSGSSAMLRLKGISNFDNYFYIHNLYCTIY